MLDVNRKKSFYFFTLLAVIPVFSNTNMDTVAGRFIYWVHNLKNKLR
jgi:hypothetical protein